MASRNYINPKQDSRRWGALSMRNDDIIVAAPVKSGTTWLQTITALLILQREDFPASLGVMSPWLDSTVTDLDEAIAALDKQEHRRFIKTHTPLDGLPDEAGMTIVAGARHPLDAATSYYHQHHNVDYKALSERIGQPIDLTPRVSEREWLTAWIDAEADPLVDTESLRGVFHAAREAWARRDQANVVLVHYDDLLNDLEGQMRRIATRLSIEVPEENWPRLVSAASFRSMSARSSELTPNMLKDRRAFFRGGRSGDGARLLTADELGRYRRLADEALGSELSSWLHRDR